MATSTANTYGAGDRLNTDRITSDSVASDARGYPRATVARAAVAHNPTYAAAFS